MAEPELLDTFADFLRFLKKIVHVAQEVHEVPLSMECGFVANTSNQLNVRLKE